MFWAKYKVKAKKGQCIMRKEVGQNGSLEMVINSS